MSKTPRDAPGPGESIGPFRLVRKLGDGGFAPVVLAEEVHEGEKLRDVALKLFFAPEGATPTSARAAAWRSAVLDEARALCRVEHPSIVRFYGVHRDDARGLLALVMEHVAGESLGARLARGGPLSERDVIDVGVATAWALAAVHEAGLVHRDVKPGNIVAAASGYKLIDFGIAARHAPLDPSPVELAGTPGYIAPECASGGAPASPAADLYALGVSLFEMLAGTKPHGGALGETLPFDANAADADTRDATRTSTPLAVGGARPSQALVMDETLAGLLARLLDPDPRARPTHAEWVARTLEKIRDALPPEAARCAPAPLATRETIGGRLPPDTPESAPRRVRATTSRSGELRAHPPLVGRDRVLETIAHAAEEARTRGLRVVILEGPAGIGRTRLLDAAVEAAGAPPERVLRARCSPERRRVLGPIARAIEALPRDAARALAALEEAVDLVAAPSADARSRAAQHSDRGESAESALEAVEEAFLWSAEAEPLLLAIDDLQWADPGTLGLLRLLVARASMSARARLLLLAATRHEPTPAAPLRALLGVARSRAHSAIRHVALDPLGDADAARLAQGVGPLSPELEAAVVRGAGGLPFLVVHALHAWRETGAIALSDGTFQPTDARAAAGEVPGVLERVESSLASSLDPGSAEERTALRALAAVALYGGGLAIETLFAVVDDAERLEGALEALEGAGLVTVAGDRQEYGFAQEMVRQAVLSLVRTRPWCFRLHRALLDVIAARSNAAGEASFLADGYERLGAIDPARRWLGCALAAAAAAGLADEAADLGDRLARLADDPRERARVELDVVRALLRGRKFEEASSRLARMEARAAVLPDDEAPRERLRRRIDRLRAARGLHARGAGDETLVADADAHGDLALACEARLALAGVAPEPSAVALATEAVERAERAEPALELAARVLRAELGYAARDRDLGLVARDLERALAIAVATASPWQRIHIEGDLAALEAEQGRAGAAIDRLRRLLDEATAHRMRGQARLLSQNLAALLLREGRAREAAETAASTAKLAMDAGDPVLAANALSIRADALRREGELDAALESIGEAERLQHRQGDRMRALTLLRRAEILIAHHRPDEALADALAARAIADEHGERAIAITAVLWEKLHIAPHTPTGRADLERALAAASAPEMSGRALTRALIARARAWLASA